MGQVINQLEKDTCKSTALAVASFIKENNLIEDKVSITPINKKKVILRSYLWSIDDNRSAEKTIYHGEDYDVYSWTCNTRTSGTLEYDDVLTDEYHNKCSM